MTAELEARLREAALHIRKLPSASMTGTTVALGVADGARIYHALTDAADALAASERGGDPRKAALDELARENEQLGLSYADAPQQEAPGAVACEWHGREAVHQVNWHEDGKNEWADVSDPSIFDGPGWTHRTLYTTPPAPVDVRKLQRWEYSPINLGMYANDSGEWIKYADVIALLDGQQAGVD